MELRHIRYLVAVADAGSFSAGAKRAFVTQPTLSAAIAALEKELGFALLERNSRGVLLTPRGEHVLGVARSMVQEMERLKTVSFDASNMKPMRLGILPTLAPAFVARTLVRLKKLDQTRAWQSEDAPLAKLRQRLTGGRYDAVLTSLGIQQRGHRQFELARDSQALAVRTRDNPRGRISPAALSGQPIIVRVHCEQLQSASRILDVWKVSPRVVARTESDIRALEMVAAGLGFCLIPDSFSHPGIRMLKPEGVDLSRRLGLEWIKGNADGWFDRAIERM
jgi:LysR family hydrogen peroxide-inducible transcriptional activator